MNRLTIAFCLFSLNITAQHSTPLNFKSYAINLCVAADKSLTLTTRSGEVGITRSIHGEWQRIDPDNTGNIGNPTLDQSNFFNHDTGFVSGYISGKDMKHDFIYLTTDGGKNWNAINFGYDGWVDDAVHIENGEAWLSVSGDGIAYTKDYGFTWHQLGNPIPKQRYAKIFFNKERQGILGSLWNSIEYTGNNCNTWKSIPTPLDQKKYIKTNKSLRPEINQVAIFKEYFLVKQEDIVFVSFKDSVDWKELPEYDNFYTDAENSALYFKDKKGKFHKADDDLSTVYSSDAINYAFDAECLDGRLYIITSEKAIVLNEDHTVASSFYHFTVADESIEPQIIGVADNHYYGFYQNGIYKNDMMMSGKWDFQYQLQSNIAEGRIAFIADKQVVYERKDDSVFYFDSTGKLSAMKSKKDVLSDFCRSNISAITFHTGSRGCFHYYDHQMKYVKDLGTFSPDEEDLNPVYKFHPSTINSISVNKFISTLPALFENDQTPSIDDLDFTDRHYEQCKKDILNFKKKVGREFNYGYKGFYLNQNNINFARLLSLVDSVKTIDKIKLSTILPNLNSAWSTTSNWIAVSFTNERNEVMVLTSNYFDPNPYYFPWSVTVGGVSLPTNSIEIYRFINKVYPDFLTDKNKMPVLHTIVKQLY